MTSLLNPQEQSKITDALTSWGVGREVIAETLTDAVFGPGLIGMYPDDPTLSIGVGILVDEHRDPALAGLFHRRRRITNDRAFLKRWRTGVFHTRLVLCPHAPEALVALGVSIERPRRLRRTYLLLASKGAHVLTYLTQPGAHVWLVPQQVGMREWAREGTGTAYDIWGQSLPLGHIQTPINSIRLALRHVGQDPGPLA